MKYIKYSLGALLVSSVFSMSVATAATSGYQQYANTYSGGKSTFTISSKIKEESNTQRIEAYSSSEISVSSKILNSNGSNTTTKTLSPGNTVVFSSTSDQAVSALPGTYTAQLSKTSITLTSKHIGGSWWLDKSYYDATH